MVYQKDCKESIGFDSSCGAEVRIFNSEKEMLQAWLTLAREYDPDCFVTFQVGSLYTFSACLAHSRVRRTKVIGLASICLEGMCRFCVCEPCMPDNPSSGDDTT